MKKLMAVLLLAVFAAIAPAVQNATAQEANEKKAASTKEFRWHGRIVRSNKDMSTLDVRKGHIERVVHYDSSTKWTKVNTETIQPSDVKDGDVVIVLGYYNEKKEFIATRIDLRTPKML